MEENRDRTVHQNFLRIMKEKKRKEEAAIAATFRKAQNEHKLLVRPNPSPQVEDMPEGFSYQNSLQHSCPAGKTREDQSIKGVVGTFDTQAVASEGLNKEHRAIGASRQVTEGLFPSPRHTMIDAWSASTQQGTNPTAIQDLETDQLMNELEDVEGKPIHNRTNKPLLTSKEGWRVEKASSMGVELWQQRELRIVSQKTQGDQEMRDFDRIVQAAPVTGLKLMEGTSVQLMRRRNPLECDEFKGRKNDASSRQQLRIEEAKSVAVLVNCMCCSTDNVLMLLLPINRGGSNKSISTKPPGNTLCQIQVLPQHVRYLFSKLLGQFLGPPRSTQEVYRSSKYSASSLMRAMGKSLQKFSKQNMHVGILDLSL